MFDAKEYHKKYSAEWVKNHRKEAKDAQKKYRARFPEKVKEYASKYHSSHKEKERLYLKSPGRKLAVRRHTLKKNFGISLEAYQVLLESQSGVCAICSDKDVLGTNLAVDHNHDTNTVRGLLCRHCNLAVGNVRESPRIALALVDYIKRHTDVPEKKRD